MNKWYVVRGLLITSLSYFFATQTASPDLNCSATNLSTGFLWEQVITPANIGANVLNKVINLEATTEEILQEVLILVSKLDNLNLSSNTSILDLATTILNTSYIINGNLNILQSQADTIISKENTLIDRTNTLNTLSPSANVKINTLSTITNSILDKTTTNLSYVDDINNTLQQTISILDTIKTCTSVQSISGSQTISTSGVYCLSRSFTGNLTIATNNVEVDLNGYTITSTGNPITVNPGLKQIALLNGGIRGGNTGISIASGVTDVELTNLKILDCSSAGINGAGTSGSLISRLRLNNSAIRNANAGIGLQFTNLTNSQITNCEIALSSTGVQLSNCSDIQLDEDTAANNLITGFSLISSSTNVFINCKALQNGIASTGNSYGFISSNGTGNIFSSCIADGTTTTTTNFNAIVAGFSLTGSEICSKIIGCEGCNATAPFTTLPSNTLIAPIPYGILLQETVVNNGQPTANSAVSTNGTTAFAVGWSPDGKYLAAINQGSATLTLFNATNSTTPVSLSTFSTGGVQPSSLTWSPDGKYIAVTNQTSNTVALFNVTDPLNPIAYPPITSGGSGARFAAWSPNGNYIAVINNGSNNLVTLNVSNPTAPIVNTPVALPAGSPIGLAWSPDGNSIAIILIASNTLVTFNTTNPTTPVANTPVSTIGTVPRFVAWSPNGKYIAVVTSGNNSLITFNATNPATPVANIPVSSGGTLPLGVTWSPDGKYLAVVNSSSNNLVTFNAFNPAVPIANTPVSTPGANPQFVTWSPDGRFIAVIINGSDILVTFNALNFPTNNIVKNNVTYCNLVSTGTTQIAGVGISGSNIANLIVDNTSQNHQFNYQFVTSPGIYSSRFNYLPSPLQNISHAGGLSPRYPLNITGWTNQIEVAVRAQQTQLDSIIDRLCTTESILAQPYQTLFQSASDILTPAVSIIDVLKQCSYQSITAAQTISTAGIYCLAQNITGEIVINADAVLLDLSGYTISGGANGVRVAGRSLATIQNGTIASVSGSGINVQAGSIATTIKNVNIELAGQYGILLNNAQSSLISGCDVSLCSTGIEIESSTKTVVTNSSAMANSIAGASLVSSGTSVFLNCKAIGNGSGSAGNSYGFVASNGSANIFERCIATGTVTTTTSFNAIVAGFALTGSESCSKIMDCQSSNNSAPSTTTTVNGVPLTFAPTPCGIYIQGTINPSNLTINSTITPGTNPRSVQWSPDNKYVAVANFGSNTIQIFGINLSAASLLTAYAPITTGTQPLMISWSPDGRYLAVANSGSNTVQIFTFNGTTSSLLTANVATAAGSAPSSVNWSPNGKYLAVANSSSNTVQVFTFNPLDRSLLTANTAISAGTGPNFANWSPDGKYLAVTSNGSSTLQIFTFNPTISTLLVANPAVTPVNVPRSPSWSPNGKYIAITDVISSLSAVQIFTFNTASSTLLTANPGVITALGPNSTSWSPDGKYLVAANTSGGSVQLFTFDPSNSSLISANTPISVGGAPFAASWSPDGRYIAVVDSVNSTLRILNAYQFPISNVIKNNTTWCNTVGTTTPSYGAGISGSSVANLIVNNIGYNNPFNTIFITNLFTELLYGNATPSPLQNISLIGRQPMLRQENINNIVDNIQIIASAMQSKTDFLYRAAFP